MSAIVRPVTYNSETHLEMIEKVHADTIVPGDKISASKSGAFQFVNKVGPVAGNDLVHAEQREHDHGQVHNDVLAGRP